MTKKYAFWSDLLVMVLYLYSWLFYCCWKQFFQMKLAGWVIIWETFKTAEYEKSCDYKLFCMEVCVGKSRPIRCLDTVFFWTVHFFFLDCNKHFQFNSYNTNCKFVRSRLSYIGNLCVWFRVNRKKKTFQAMLFA